MAKKSGDQPQEFLVRRSGTTDFRFSGFRLAAVEQTQLGDFEKALIYRTVGGAYVAHYVTGSTLYGVKDASAAKCTGADEIVKFFTVFPTNIEKRTRARVSKQPSEPAPEPVGRLRDIGKLALEAAGELDSKLRGAHIEMID